MRTPSRRRRILPLALLSLAGLVPPAAASDPATAFVGAILVSPESGEVRRGQTVLVEGGRIAAIGPDGAVLLPEGTRRIAAAGRHLLPGIIDAHVHLDRYVGARPEFGDAPLFLAHGVTTVVNLRGEPEHLAVRARIAAGELLAPTLLTSGEFVNEPRVRTPEEAAAEVAAQRAAGYDLIKFREVIDFERHRQATTVGLGRAAYLRLAEAAREEGMPLVGHHPFNLAYADLLAARQSLAHLNELANLRFLPPLDLWSGPWMALTRWSWLSLAGALLLLALLGRLRSVPAGEGASVLWPGAVLLLLAVAAAGVWLLVVPPGLRFGELGLLVLLSACGLALLVAAGLVLVRAGRTAASRAHPLSRWAPLLAVLPALAVAVAATHWVAFAWRSAPFAVERVARDLKAADVAVITTLACQESYFARHEGFRPGELENEPTWRALRSELREAWSRFPPGAPGWMGRLWRRHPEFLRTLAAALAREQVPLLAGTDALGVPRLVPGHSLHQELGLLHEAGLSPRQVLASATVAPATFLGHPELGRIAVGAQADLLLVEGDPLADLGVLARPLGVMVRGTWLDRARLDALLEALTPEPPPNA